MAASTLETIDVQIRDSLAEAQPKTSAIADATIKRTDPPIRRVMGCSSTPTRHPRTVHAIRGEVRRPLLPLVRCPLRGLVEVVTASSRSVEPSVAREVPTHRIRDARRRVSLVVDPRPGFLSLTR